MDVCEVCGGDLFMLASEEVTCLNRCRFIVPDSEQFKRLVGNRIQRVPHQLREFSKAMKQYNELVDEA